MSDHKLFIAYTSSAKAIELETGNFWIFSPIIRIQFILDLGYLNCAQ